MTWDSVPWLVAGGAEHSAEVGRMLPYSALSGEEGIAGARDLTVRALATPGGAVTVDVGACTINSRYAGGQYQAYQGRKIAREQVTVSPTGAEGRTDLVIARVEDPNPTGSAWPLPADPIRGPYIFTRVIAGVPSGVTKVQQVPGRENDTAITLGRIAIPANTSAITQAMITDLRYLAQPRRRRLLFTRALTGTETDEAQVTAATNPDGEIFPNAAQWFVDVPQWATRCRVRADWAQVRYPAGNSYGRMWVRFGTKNTQQVAFNAPDVANVSRSTVVCADDIVIPPSMRGGTFEWQLRAVKDGGPVNVSVDAFSATVLDVEFLEQPDPS